MEDMGVVYGFGEEFFWNMVLWLVVTKQVFFLISVICCFDM